MITTNDLQSSIALYKSHDYPSCGILARAGRHWDDDATSFRDTAQAEACGSDKTATFIRLTKHGIGSTRLSGPKTSHSSRKNELSIGGIGLRFGTLLFLLIAPSAAQAQSERSQAANQPALQPQTPVDDVDDLGLLDMDIPIVVTATRTARTITSIPYAVSIVTSEQIRAFGARSIPDALRLVPGIDIADLSFGNAAVSARGFHGFIASQMLVLVDGRQIFDSLFGGTLWGSWPFMLEDVERIEVIRGPGGVTWGGNAVNGVINIITKDPADQNGLTLTTRGGSRGTFKQYVGVGATEGDFRLRFSTEYEASDGYKDGGSILGNLADDYKAGRFSLHAVYDKSSTDRITISAGSSIVDGGYPPTPTAGIGGLRNSGSQASYILGKWERMLEDDAHVEVTTFVNDFHVSPGVAAIDYRYQQFGLLFSHSYHPDDQRTRIWGVDGRVDILDATNSAPFMLTKGFVSTGTVGLYLQEDIRLSSRWRLELGGRIDYESYTGFQPSARVSLSYKFSDTTMLYGAVSRAFHSPPAASRFVNIPLLNGLVFTTADRDVDPTTLLAYELGLRSKLFNKIDASANLFWHEYDDATTLSPRLGPPGLINLRFDNAGSVSLYGFELELTYPIADRLTLLGNYTFQQLDWRSSVPFTDQDFITPPRNKFMVAAQWAPVDDVSISARLSYVDAVESPGPLNIFSPIRIDPYLRLDLRAEKKLWDDDSFLAVGVRNLLDPRHREGATTFLNDAEVPRTVYAEFHTVIR